MADTPTPQPSRDPRDARTVSVRALLPLWAAVFFTGVAVAALFYHMLPQDLAARRDGAAGGPSGSAGGGEQPLVPAPRAHRPKSIGLPEDEGAAGLPATAPSSSDDPDIRIALGMERAFQKIAARVQPSVVSLKVKTGELNWEEKIQRMHQYGGAPQRDPFTGSGVIIDPDGTILTNEHVVRGAEEIRVETFGGGAFRAEVLGTDPRSDLAVIRPIDPLPKKLPAVSLGDSDAVQVGQWALAVGNPFDLSNTLTLGVVSARGRSLRARSLAPADVLYTNLIQTDAAINPGNSGGPLFNLKGELIGINTMIYSRSGRSEGFGFAIPANDIVPRLAFLRKGMPVEYGWLGVQMDELDPEQPAFLNNGRRGVLLSRILPDSPADRAGLQKDSVLLNFDGIDVETPDDLMLAVGKTPAGKTVKLRLMDPQGHTVTKEVRIGLRSKELLQPSAFHPQPSGEPAMPPMPPRENELDWRGMRLRELPAEEAEKLGGALRVTNVLKDTPADRAGFYEGAIVDKIRYAESQETVVLKSIAQFRKMARETQDGVYLHSPIFGFVLVDADRR
ncbi:MAG: trypsin-like peptidase domain-containing protein [Planctomycetes bacterium]|nr:trypsin-like peptidase domain-containing protein [Planctomycetota bacterium]